MAYISQKEYNLLVFQKDTAERELKAEREKNDRLKIALDGLLGLDELREKVEDISSKVYRMDGQIDDLSDRIRDEVRDLWNRDRE